MFSLFNDGESQDEACFGTADSTIFLPNRLQPNCLKNRSSYYDSPIAGNRWHILKSTLAETMDETLKTILEAAGNAMMLVDAGRRIIMVNRPFEKLAGFRAEEVVGRDTALLSADCHDQTFCAAMDEKIVAEKGWMGDLRLRRGDGETRTIRLSVKDLGPGPESARYLYIYHDDRTSAEALRIHQSNIDGLTGLPTAQIFRDRINQILITSRRIEKSVALLLIGLDRFSRINDALGRNFGNLVMKETAARLISCIRRSDTAARLGGDLFAVITPITSLDDSVIVAEKVLKSISRPFEIDNSSVVITSSIGISLYPTDADDPENLEEQATSALGYAKRRGGDRYQFFDNEMNSRAKKRLELESGLRTAISRQEFLVYYQPKVNVLTETIVGMEALVRWQDPVRGLVSPAEFIPAAEETGLINQIGYWVLHQACAQNKKWQEQGLTPVRVAVNVSSRQFLEKDMVDRVRTILRETGLGPDFLELELTESMLMGDIEKNITKMLELRDLGIRLSIDDFGTGYSSLSYLARFPITTLKIDRAFVKDLGTSTSTVEIARAIIALSQGLKLEIVAEGAETQHHIDFLKSHGCDTVQGFFYSPPVPAANFEKLLAALQLHGVAWR